MIHFLNRDWLGYVHSRLKSYYLYYNSSFPSLNWLLHLDWPAVRKRSRRSIPGRPGLTTPRAHTGHWTHCLTGLGSLWTGLGSGAGSAQTQGGLVVIADGLSWHIVWGQTNQVNKTVFLFISLCLSDIPQVELDILPSCVSSTHYFMQIFSVPPLHVIN